MQISDSSSIWSAQWQFLPRKSILYALALDTDFNKFAAIYHLLRTIQVVVAMHLWEEKYWVSEEVVDLISTRFQVNTSISNTVEYFISLKIIIIGFRM